MQVDTYSSFATVFSAKRLRQTHDLLWKGEVLSGRFRLDFIIDHGGVGFVWSGFDLEEGGRVAIKLPREDRFETSCTQIEAEVRALSMCKNSCAVQILASGTHGNTPYLVMEYIYGETLYEHLMQHGALRQDDALRIIIPLIHAVASLHQQGIVHGDLKPGNIMLTFTQDKGVKVTLIDMSMSEHVRVLAMKKRSKKIQGSPSYMAPELTQGLAISTHSDVYALGVIFYQMLSGERPFQGETMDVLFQQVHKIPVDLEDLLPGTHDLASYIADMVHRCLAKKSEHRFAHADDLLIDGMWMMQESCRFHMVYPQDIQVLSVV